MLIDIAAPAYHSSALKITRLTRFFAILERDAGFLTPFGLGVLFLDISHPLLFAPSAS
jgi:hypothetical protein